MIHITQGSQNNKKNSYHLRWITNSTFNSNYNRLTNYHQLIFLTSFPIVLPTIPTIPKHLHFSIVNVPAFYTLSLLISDYWGIWRGVVLILPDLQLSSISQVYWLSCGNLVKGVVRQGRILREASVGFV